MRPRPAGYELSRRLWRFTVPRTERQGPIQSWLARLGRPEDSLTRTSGCLSAAPRPGCGLPACLMPTPRPRRSRARCSSSSAIASRASVLVVSAGNSNTSVASNGFLACTGGPCFSAGAASGGTAGAVLVTAGAGGFRFAACHTVAAVIPTPAKANVSPQMKSISPGAVTYTFTSRDPAPCRFPEPLRQEACGTFVAYCTPAHIGAAREMRPTPDQCGTEQYGAAFPLSLASASENPQSG
jgi:hypothetical protein